MLRVVVISNCNFYWRGEIERERERGGRGGARDGPIRDLRSNCAANWNCEEQRRERKRREKMKMDRKQIG